MYRLLILDDEPIIVKGLVQLFSEMEEELDIYPAYSVSEALSIAIQLKIDVVITDMRMPEKSGLQFIDELQSYWPQCRIIFLSGYDNFDYVYNAMKRNIDSYVLKTEDDEVLIEAVRKSIRRIQDERTFLKLMELSDSQLKGEIKYPVISRKEKDHDLIFRVNEYIKENISGDLTLSSIAKSVYLNPSYLSRFYKERTGINISDFINQIKVDKAKYYLSETEMYIQTIASKLGFNSPSYFTLFFKKNVAIPPQDYREHSRKK